MEIREIFVQGSYWITPIIISLFLVWVGLQVYILIKRAMSHYSGGSTAGTGHGRIGPKD